MKKKTLTFGDRDIVIAELNTAQVEELLNDKAPDGSSTQESKEWWHRRFWRTIVLAVNNVKNPPSKENPVGSDTDPLSVEDLRPTIGYASASEIHAAVFRLSGLKTATSGESKADAESDSTSTLSTAA